MGSQRFVWFNGTVLSMRIIARVKILCEEPSPNYAVLSLGIQKTSPKVCVHKINFDISENRMVTSPNKQKSNFSNKISNLWKSLAKISSIYNCCRYFYFQKTQKVHFQMLPFSPKKFFPVSKFRTL
mgnify:CR=1 FL=1